MRKLKLLLLLWLMLVGFASGYSQEAVKCIVIETNSGVNVECVLSKHPKLAQNNDVVTLTTDDAVTEFSTTDIKKVYFGEDKYLYKLVYYVDDELYKTYKYEVGEAITPEEAPTKEGYTFSGWSDIPATMPAKDVTVTGTFTVNKYKLVYKVDGEDYKSYDVEYGATITPEAEPTKEGYTFSGWSDIPTTMPAKNVTVTGTFTINKYTVSYVIDNEVFQEDKLEFGAKIVPPEAPKRDGYDFSWGEYPETMPAKDIVITGTYVTGINGVVYSSVLQYNGDYYTLNGLDANESVIVYAASGEIILRSTASEKGELIIRTSQLSNGVNIIKTKNQLFKVIR